MQSKYRTKKRNKSIFQRTLERYEIIYINSELDEHEEKYICTHELGHAILHTNMSLGFFIENTMQVKNRYEIQADKFATALLIKDRIEGQ